MCVLNDEIWTPQAYLEELTGECYPYPNWTSDVDFIRRYSLPLGIKDYSLFETEKALKTKAEGLLLVLCFDVDKSRYEPRWFELLKPLREQEMHPVGATDDTQTI